MAIRAATGKPHPSGVNGKNRYNPAPQKEVFWSEQSWDEMFIPWFEYTVDSKDLTKPAATQSAGKQ